MKTLRIFAALVGLVMVSACNTVAPSGAELDGANYGTLVKNYQEHVKFFMDTRLRDPASAIYGSCSEPRKAWARYPYAQGNPLKYGWIVRVDINAKNGFGGYTGTKFYNVLFYPEGNGWLQMEVPQEWFYNGLAGYADGSII